MTVRVRGCDPVANGSRANSIAQAMCARGLLAALMTDARTLARRRVNGQTRARGPMRAMSKAGHDATLSETLAAERENQKNTDETADFLCGRAVLLKQHKAKFAGR